MHQANPLTARMRRVCMELARLRRERGMSGADVERLLGIPNSTLSRIENCERAVKRDDLTALLVVYRVDRPFREAMLKLHIESGQPGLLDEDDLQVHEELATWIGFEQDAIEIRNYQYFLLPGLLQTEDYAREVIMRVVYPWDRPKWTDGWPLDWPDKPCCAGRLVLS